MKAFPQVLLISDKITGHKMLRNNFGMCVFLFRSILSYIVQWMLV